MSENTAPERIDLGGLVEQLESAHEYQRHLEAENRRLTSELEELKAELDLARGVLGHPDMERAIHKLGTVPRVITAEELKAGQLICIHRGHVWGVRAIGTFSTLEDDVVTLKTGGSGVFSENVKFHTIVLLADAPAEEPEPVKVGDTISDVELLLKLPYGTILRAPEGDAFERNPQGWWPTGTVTPMSSLGIIDYAPFTILYLPEEDA